MGKERGGKFFWLFILLALIVGIIIGIVPGLSVYWWQKSSFEQKGAELKKANRTIQELKARVAQLESEREEAPPAVTPSPKTTKPKVTRQCGYIKRVYKSGGKNYLDIDYIQFLTGEEADEAAREDGEIGPGEHVPNDYYIRNENPRIRKLEIDRGVKVFVETYNEVEREGIIVRKRSLDFKTFKQVFETNDPNNQVMIQNPYWITLQDSIVVKIEEQYIP